MGTAYYRKRETLFDPNGEFAAAIRKHIALRQSECGGASFLREVFWFPAKQPPHKRAVDLVDEYVISKLPRPLVFTRDDLLETLHAQLGRASMTDGFEPAWNRVLAFITESIAGFAGDTWAAFDLGTWAPPDREPTAENDDPRYGYLWCSECDHFMLDVQWKEEQAEALLGGSATPRAVAQAVSQMRDICQTAATTIRTY
jgi:hypothetical protein